MDRETIAYSLGCFADDCDDEVETEADNRRKLLLTQIAHLLRFQAGMVKDGRIDEATSDALLERTKNFWSKYSREG